MSCLPSCALPRSEALEHLEYPKRLRKLLLTPEREVAVELALLRDNGEVGAGRQQQLRLQGHGRKGRENGF